MAERFVGVVPPNFAIICDEYCRACRSHGQSGAKAAAIKVSGCDREITPHPQCGHFERHRVVTGKLIVSASAHQGIAASATSQNVITGVPICDNGCCHTCPNQIVSLRRQGEAFDLRECERI